MENVLFVTVQDASIQANLKRKRRKQPLLLLKDHVAPAEGEMEASTVEVSGNPVAHVRVTQTT